MSHIKTPSAKAARPPSGDHQRAGSVVVIGAIGALVTPPTHYSKSSGLKTMAESLAKPISGYNFALSALLICMVDCM